MALQKKTRECAALQQQLDGAMLAGTNAAAGAETAATAQQGNPAGPVANAKVGAADMLKVLRLLHENKLVVLREDPTDSLPCADAGKQPEQHHQQYVWAHLQLAVQQLLLRLMEHDMVLGEVDSPSMVVLLTPAAWMKLMAEVRAVLKPSARAPKSPPLPRLPPPRSPKRSPQTKLQASLSNGGSDLHIVDAEPSWHSMAAAGAARVGGREKHVSPSLGGPSQSANMYMCRTVCFKCLCAPGRRRSGRGRSGGYCDHHAE